MKTISPKEVKRATMSDVARIAGVTPATVSYVLSGSKKDISISFETRRNVEKAAAKCNYQINFAARALSTQKSRHIGFMLSDTVTRGLQNPYFAKYLEGIERVSRERKYHLVLSLYNFDNIDSFVFPDSVKQKSVDGIILAGYVSASVANKFRELGIPVLVLGDNTETVGIVPTVATDVVSTIYKGVQYLSGLGHKKMWLPIGDTRREQQVLKLIHQKAKRDGLNCSVEAMPFKCYCDDRDAKPIFDVWNSIQKKDRPTAILSSDQTTVALLYKLIAAGYEVPRDISLLSLCETIFTTIARPQLTAFDSQEDKLGAYVANILIDNLENNTMPTDSISVSSITSNLIIRDSCGRAPE